MGLRKVLKSAEKCWKVLKIQKSFTYMHAHIHAYIQNKQRQLSFKKRYKSHALYIHTCMHTYIHIVSFGMQKALERHHASVVAGRGSRKEHEDPCMLRGELPLRGMCLCICVFVCFFVCVGLRKEDEDPCMLQESYLCVVCACVYVYLYVFLCV